MFRKKALSIAAISVLSLFFTGCTSSTTPVPVQQTPIEVKKVETPSAQLAPHKEAYIDLSQKSAGFHSGMNDGCATAKGKYTKDPALYNNETDYKDGWFYGRRKCQPHRAA